MTTNSDCGQGQGHFSDLEIDNLPNRLTLFRVLLIPVIIGCLSFSQVDPDWAWAAKYATDLEWVAAWVFAVAAITDFVDGYIARKRNIITVFGSFLDPVADKFLTVSSLIMIHALGRVHAIIVIILILREMYMTSLRLLAVGEGLSVPVNWLGKWKTTTQMVGIPMLMVSTTPYGIPFPIMGKVLIYIASFLSLYSSVVYSVGLVKKIKQKRLERRQRRSSI
ncbi:MAG: CDP-diacylglycerol--glycerol-3-phosphate 3-phosphatidyltransferase [Oligoflexia bacterium]|nr:CDP-diacylglycerol--glycerol-3-phosphate 3-phosphatidyltransferase [Oligoflexia bacterium]MBF0365502.1 CDP-diacylglycerol--glycerol-3-phosphate 3-phosphatidyltransferase [Oligoflexia bacterium]